NTAVPNAHAWFYVDARTIDGQYGALTERDDDLRGILGWCLATRISSQSVLDYGRKWRLHHNNSHGRAGGLSDFDHLLLLVIHFDVGRRQSKDLIPILARFAGSFGDWPPCSAARATSGGGLRAERPHANTTLSSRLSYVVNFL